MPEPESPPIGPLLKATTNYLTSIGRQPSADEGRALEAHLLTLKAEQIDSLTGRLALYQLLDGQTGRDLREAANNSSTLLAAQLRQEQSHVRSVLQALIDPMRPADLSALLESVPSLAPGLTADPVLLYQETLYAGDQQAAAAEVLKPGAKKWIELVSPAFKDRRLGELIDRLGFVPDQLYRTKKFRETMSFADLARCHETLREHPQGNQARAQLIRHLLLNGFTRQADGGKIQVDTNGLWLHFERHAKGNVDRLDAHLPFAYTDNDLLETLYNERWLTVHDVTEAKLRRAEVNHDRKAIAFFEEVQARQYLELTERERQSRKDLSPSEAAADAELFGRLKHLHGDALFEAINTSGLSLIPDSNLASNSTGRLPIGSVRLYLREGRRNSEDPNETLKAVHIAKVFADAIDIQRRLAAVPLTSNPTTNQQPPTDRQVANDARNYHALRLVGAILDELAETGLQPCGLQRRGNQDADLWTLVSAENPAEALLLRPDKHLNKRQRETFFALPEAPLRS